MFTYGRQATNVPELVTSREWLVTNGIGGYASGTVSGVLTRRYHGLLMAALKPPLGRTLMVSKFDETAVYADQPYPLFTNSWSADSLFTNGYVHLNKFHLEGTTPVWTYALGDALLEKRIFMEQGENKTFVTYRYVRGQSPITLKIKAIVNYRGYHDSTTGENWIMDVERVEHGLKITPHDLATPYYIFASSGTVTPEYKWYRNYHLAVEAYRGQNAREDNFYAGEFVAEVAVGETLTLVAATETGTDLDGENSYQEQRAHEIALLAWSKMKGGLPQKDDAYQAQLTQLVLASEQFIVQRKLEGMNNGRSIIAGYPWFGDWGRDTMISLPGLTLTTGRTKVAEKILRTFSRYVDKGMLPNRFPDDGEEPEYNTMDATLWYFEAIRAYVAQTNDLDLLRDLFPILQDAIAWHQLGTRYNIKQDPKDGLLYGGQDGVQLTWMDAKVKDWVVTPRIGKPVEINALWYNALRSMADFATLLDEDPKPFDTIADQVKEGFQRYWRKELGYLCDVLDSGGTDDESLRPNQLFAVSLHHSPLKKKQQKAVVDVCLQHLLTPHGLRSLAPNDANYIGVYGGTVRKRDGAYHQGTTWGWLIGSLVSAHLRVYGDKSAARSFLLPLIDSLNDHCIGNLSEIFDGDAPFTPRGCFAQAWTVAEVLRTWQETEGK